MKEFLSTEEQLERMCARLRALRADPEITPPWKERIHLLLERTAPKPVGAEAEALLIDGVNACEAIALWGKRA